jgi:enoyl-CoA hydratase
MPYKQIRYQKNGRIAKVVMDRPRYHNAQSRVMLEEMNRAFAEAEADDDVRVIVLAGEGKDFSSGHDLGTAEEREDAERRPYQPSVRGQHKRSWDLFVDLTLKWRDVEKPTIAQVQGYCIFGGWMIASAMDLIVASEDAMFLPSLLQYFSIPWDIGVRKAREILYQSRFVPAAEAERLGFVNMVVPRERLEEETMALAARIAESEPFALRMLKLAINNAQDAAGFRTAVRNAHSHHLLLALGTYLGERLQGKPIPRRLAGVEQALKKLKRGGER